MLQMHGVTGTVGTTDAPDNHFIGTPRCGYMDAHQKGWPNKAMEADAKRARGSSPMR